MIYADLDLVGHIEVKEFDEILNIPELVKYCITPSFKGLCYNTVDEKMYVLFMEYTNPVGWMRIGTFTTTLTNLKIPRRD